MPDNSKRAAAIEAATMVGCKAAGTCNETGICEDAGVCMIVGRRDITALEIAAYLAMMEDTRDG